MGDRITPVTGMATGMATWMHVCANDFPAREASGGLCSQLDRIAQLALEDACILH